MEVQECKKPVVLLSYYLNENFKLIFEMAGFEVLHRDHFSLKLSAVGVVREALQDREKFQDRMMCEKEIIIRQYITWLMSYPIDAVIEWQHGDEDFPLLDMFHRIRNDIVKLAVPNSQIVVDSMENFIRRPAFILCLNWNKPQDEKWKSMGYSHLLPVPFDMDDLMVIRSFIVSRRPDKFKIHLNRPDKIRLLGQLKRYSKKLE